ncbi:hypothetical protein EAH87_14975 [Sphingomonas koreensis]|nr:hypothetical protein EAH87_14975 [Sphingomonas koreensis]
MLSNPCDQCAMDGEHRNSEPPAWLAVEERKRQRIQTCLAASLTTVWYINEPVELVDISPLGCRVKTARSISIGSYVTLAIHSFSSIDGWVAWRGRECFGLDFSRELSDDLLGHIVSLGADKA